MPKIGEINKIVMNSDEFNNIMNSLQIPNKERDAYKKEWLGESESSVNIDQIQYLGNPEDMLKIKENADNANIKYDRIGHSNTSDNNMIIGCHIEKNNIDFSKISYSYANVNDEKFISKERIYDNVWPINLKYDLYENGIVRFYTENDKGEKTWYGWSKIEYCVDAAKKEQLMEIFKIDENNPKIEYDENGNIKKESEYFKNGNIKSKKEYNSDGKLVKEIDYFETGGISYIKEKGVEIWYYENDNIKKELECNSDGELVKEIDYYITGEISFIEEDGVEIFYCQDGSISEIDIDDEMIEISFYDGQVEFIKKDGVELIYNSSEYNSIDVNKYIQDAINRRKLYEENNR